MTKADTPAVTNRHSETITLAEPIVRGETQITELTLRKPKAGELRGLSLQELMTAGVSATLEILPRISMPPITEQEAENLEPQDVAAVAGAVIGFFLTAKDQAKIKEASKR